MCQSNGQKLSTAISTPVYRTHYSNEEKTQTFYCNTFTDLQVECPPNMASIDTINSLTSEINSTWVYLWCHLALINRELFRVSQKDFSLVWCWYRGDDWRPIRAARNHIAITVYNLETICHSKTNLKITPASVKSFRYTENVTLLRVK